IPVDRPRPVVKSYEGDRVGFSVGEGVLAGLRRVAREESTTLFTVLAAAYALVLGRAAGQDRLILGTPSTNRNSHELEGVIGNFLDLLPIPVDAGGSTLRGLVQQVRAEFLRAHELTGVSFRQLVDGLGVGRDLSTSPLVQAVLALQSV
ncbi:condensation domain-containing protein, partial [Streptomyces cyaneofuscatus]|uniref:condensation domain-containing protein n=1 Tax=Streptomyces cyaneofuscatus TaxID=66883 RepID=UPI000516B834